MSATTIEHTSRDARIALDALHWTGQGLRRPECVLATRAGDLYCADWRGGVSHLRPHGTQTLVVGAAPDGIALRPNGIALQRDGGFLLAELGDERGGVYRLTRDGAVAPFVTAVDGLALPPTNFVLEDVWGRVWITVSTRHQPRAAAYRREVADGFIVLVDARGARIVADGLGYTNECAVSADGAFLYANETFARRLSRFRIGADGALGTRETVTTFGAGTYPDGLTFDVEGHAWVTSIISNRVLRVAPDGATELILEDADAAHVAACERAWLGDGLGRPHLDTAAGRVLKNISSLAFGGPDLRTAYLGCLQGAAIASFTASVPGVPPAHWWY